jgi:hypothetical protein
MGNCLPLDRRGRLRNGQQHSEHSQAFDSHGANVPHGLSKTKPIGTRVPYGKPRPCGVSQRAPCKRKMHRHSVCQGKARAFFSDLSKLVQVYVREVDCERHTSLPGGMRPGPPRYTNKSCFKASGAPPYQLSADIIVSTLRVRSKANAHGATIGV